VNARPGPGRTAPPILIGYSRTVAALFLVAAAGGVGWVGFIALLGLLSRHIVIGITGALALIVFVPMLSPLLVACVKALRERDPVVTLDDLGVTDTRLDPSFVAWADVGRIELGVGHTGSILGIEFRDRAVTREHIGPLARLRTVLRRTRWLGDWNVDLRLLSCKPARVLADAQRLHRESIRQRIVELNRDRPAGWSGSL
jgi:hypothetical protein